MGTVDHDALDAPPWVFADLPKVLGFGSEPLRWPVPVPVVAGALGPVTSEPLDLNLT